MAFIPAMQVQIPVLSTLSQRSKETTKVVRPRYYSPGPLPTKLSQDAPRKGKIIERRIDFHGAFYKVRIGGVVLDDVGIEEVLDYVSPQDLEEYELTQFDEERELLSIAASDSETSGNEGSDSEPSAHIEDRDQPVHINTEAGSSNAETSKGRHGRARPTYTHLFLQAASQQAIPKRRRRKRDPKTGELLPLSDRDDESSLDEAARLVHADNNNGPQKRRRRKRDPVTGELLPLPPLPPKRETTHNEDSMVLDVSKRPRRRRHPITKELMPLGWRYEPDAPEERAKTASHSAVQSVQGLSLHDNREAKRPRLASLSSSASRPADPMDWRDEFVDEQLQPSSKNLLNAVSSAQNTNQDARTTRNALSPGPRVTDDGGRNSMLSILRSPTRSSSATRSASGDSDTHKGDSNAVQNSDEDGEWGIDAIVAHRMSDPRTHGPGMGKTPVMLYLVKWDTGEESWEPVESFPDRSVILDYERQLTERRRQVAPKRVHTQPSDKSSLVSAIASRHDQKTGADKSPLAQPLTAATSAPPSRPAQSETKATSVSREAPVIVISSGSDEESSSTSGSGSDDESSGDDDDDDDDEDEHDNDEEYAVEAILGHHLSDPRTHPPSMDKRPVMLYKVKWKGYENATWEPLSSFGDRRIIDEYRRRAGHRS